MKSLDEDTRRTLGKLLRELRHREGLTLSRLSQQVGVSQSALSQFESGRSEPSLGTLWSLGTGTERIAVRLLRGRARTDGQHHPGERADGDGPQAGPL